MLSNALIEMAAPPTKAMRNKPYVFLNPADAEEAGFAEGEKIAAMICVKEFSESLHLAMATKNGITKKTNLADYTNATREGGLRGIKLEEGDTLIGCVLTKGTDEVVLVSYKGQAVRFKEEDLRDQGRDTVGVTGMGGGALMTPILVLLFGVDPPAAVSTG